MLEYQAIFWQYLTPIPLMTLKCLIGLLQVRAASVPKPSSMFPSLPVRTGSAPEVSSKQNGLLSFTRNGVQSSLPDLHVTLRKGKGKPTESLNAHASLGSNIMPSDLRHSWACESSYQSQFPTGGTKSANYVDLSFKKDERFNWEPGCGTPRPQSSLLDLQNAFRKSDVRRKFHENFSETNPDLRENHTRGRKHEFGGINAQVFRGATIVD